MDYPHDEAGRISACFSYFVAERSHLIAQYLGLAPKGKNYPDYNPVLAGSDSRSSWEILLMPETIQVKVGLSHSSFLEVEDYWQLNIPGFNIDTFHQASQEEGMQDVYDKKVHHIAVVSCATDRFSKLNFEAIAMLGRMTIKSIPRHKHDLEKKELFLYKHNLLKEFKALWCSELEKNLSHFLCCMAQQNAAVYFPLDRDERKKLKFYGVLGYQNGMISIYVTTNTSKENDVSEMKNIKKELLNIQLELLDADSEVLGDSFFNKSSSLWGQDYSAYFSFPSQRVRSIDHLKNLIFYKAE